MHKDREFFKQVITDIQEQKQIFDFFIEKDYWVFRVLKHLKEGRYGNAVVFKGGTALSKCHKITNRFSEDIDISLDSNSLVSKSGHITQGFIQSCNSRIKNDLIVNFLPLDEKVDFQPQGALKSVPLCFSPIFHHDAVKASLLVELNAIDLDNPCQEMSVSSIIADYLEENNRSDIIRRFALEPFTLKVGTVQKTFCEKLFRLNKLSVSDNPLEKIGTKLRDVYDIMMIVSHPQYKDYIYSGDFVSDMQKVEIFETGRAEKKIAFKKSKNQHDEAKQLIQNNQWLHQPIHRSPIFADPDMLLKINPTFKSNLDLFIFDNKPTMKQLIDPLREITKQLERFDRETGKISQNPQLLRCSSKLSGIKQKTHQLKSKNIDQVCETVSRWPEYAKAAGVDQSLYEKIGAVHETHINLNENVTIVKPSNKLDAAAGDLKKKNRQALNQSSNRQIKP